MSAVAPSVLIVEDDPSQARLLHRWLASAGLHAEIASDGESGLDLATRRRWDLVISDVDLPGRSGIDVLRAAKAAHPETPAVLVTAFGRLETATRAIDLGVDAFVLKPLRREDFVGRVVALCDEKRSRRATVLAIGAHPDDVEIGVGGALADHVARGDRVVILTLSSGARGGARVERRREAARSAATLGAELLLADLPDTQFSPSGETIRVIEEAVNQIRPTIAYTHAVEDVHQDHRATHHASLVALRNVPTVLGYQSPSASLAFRPARFVDITDHIDTKMALIRCFAGQVAKCDYLAEDLLRSTARYWGRFGRVRFAEPLVVVRDVASSPLRRTA